MKRGNDRTLDLFANERRDPVKISEGVWLHPGGALEMEEMLLNDLENVVKQAPFRHMTTRRGHKMSVAMTNCGESGWVSDRRGYRYSPSDPESGLPWPAMPLSFLKLARKFAGGESGFDGFRPDVCLINRYEVGAKMGLHQDKDEVDFSAPIVSVSLGLPATFVLGGMERTGPTRRIPLEHGDVIVWGGPARLLFHGILPLKTGEHPRLGPLRINLTFRKAH